MEAANEQHTIQLQLTDTTHRHLTAPDSLALKVQSSGLTGASQCVRWYAVIPTGYVIPTSDRMPSLPCVGHCTALRCIALHCTALATQLTSRVATASEFGTIIPPLSFENNMKPIAKYTFGEEVCSQCCNSLVYVVHVARSGQPCRPFAKYDTVAKQRHEQSLPIRLAMLWQFCSSAQMCCTLLLPPCLTGHCLLYRTAHHRGSHSGHDRPIVLY